MNVSVTANYSPKEVIAQAKHLWRVCFDDSPNFLDFYFKHVATPEATLIGYNPEGKAIAHIGLPRYALTISPDTRLESLYISGACVLPEYRKDGVMRQLMLGLMAEQNKEGGADVLVLIPADEQLRSYYARTFGFVTCGRESWQAGEELALSIYKDEPLIPTAEPELLLQQSLSYRLGLALSEAQCVQLLDAYRLEEGVAALTYRNVDTGLYEGLLLITYKQREMSVWHIIGSEEVRKWLLGVARHLHGLETIQTRVAHQGEAKGMIRPLRLLPILEGWSRQHPDQLINFTYRDELCPQLSGSYQGIAGKVDYTPEFIKAEELSLEEVCERYLPDLDISLVLE